MLREAELRDLDADTAIHEIRKRLKKLRALAKVFRYLPPTGGGERTEAAIRAVVDNLKGITQDSPAPESPEDPDALIKGFKRVYRRARHGHQASFHASYPDPEADFHEYRKRAKYHYLQTQLLQSAWPKIVKPRRKAVEALAIALGECIFVEEPKHLCRRVQCHWEQSRSSRTPYPVNA